MDHGPADCPMSGDVQALGQLGDVPAISDILGARPTIKKPVLVQAAGVTALRSLQR